MYIDSNLYISNNNTHDTDDNQNNKNHNAKKNISDSGFFTRVEHRDAASALWHREGTYICYLLARRDYIIFIQHTPTRYPLTSTGEEPPFPFLGTFLRNLIVLGEPDGCWFATPSILRSPGWVVSTVNGMDAKNIKRPSLHYRDPWPWGEDQRVVLCCYMVEETVIKQCNPFT